jgi:hypothetical protein
MRPLAFLAGISAGLALTACDIVAPVEPVPVPPERPAVTPEPEPPRTVAPGPESRELAAYYQRVQDGLLSQGLLRTDGGGPDTPFNKRQLVENFVRIAIYEEDTTVGGRLVAQQNASRLHRWESPVRMQLEFGETVPREVQVRDRNAVTSYAKRLSRITGLPIEMVGAGGNYHVFILNEAERRKLGPRLRQIVPGLPDSTVRAITELPRSDYCIVFALDPTDSGVYTKAVAVIRAEHPDLMRLSCIHEEVAQGLGLSNDSPAARPSIFNDDEEFGLLTEHDEYLLRLLYDPRMKPGMDPATARATANVIAAEYFAGES